MWTATSPGRRDPPSRAGRTFGLRFQRHASRFPSALSGPGRSANGPSGRETGRVPAAAPCLSLSSAAEFGSPRSSLSVGVSAHVSCEDVFQSFPLSVSRTQPCVFVSTKRIQERKADAGLRGRVSLGSHPAVPPASVTRFNVHQKHRRGHVLWSAEACGARGGPVQLVSRP